MRRLINKTSKIMAVFLVGLFLTFCSIATFSAHGNSVKSAKAGCSISCHSDGQHSGTNFQKREVDEDDKEPTPPLFTWPQVSADLGLLYILPLFAALWFGYQRNNLHLTSQLRL